MNAKAWAVRYVDENRGCVKQKEFKTEAARSRWIDRQLSEGAITVLAYSGPQ